jgi:hypothetical protein
MHDQEETCFSETTFYIDFPFKELRKDGNCGQIAD